MEAHTNDASTNKETSTFSSRDKLPSATSKNNEGLIRSDQSAEGANTTTFGKKLIF